MGYSAQKYGHTYRKRRAACLARNRHQNAGLCVYCGLRPATEADHQPPLFLYPDPTQWNGELVASCRTCAGRQGAQIINSGAHRRRLTERASRRWL